MEATAIFTFLSLWCCWPSFLRPQNTQTNYKQAEFSRRSSNQFRNSTKRNVAKYEQTENFTVLKDDKPAKAEETLDADSSKINKVKL